MEPLIKLSNKNNLFDCTIYKTTETLFNGNQQKQHQQHSVSYLSSHQSHEDSIQQQALEEISDAVHHQQLRDLLLIL